MLTFTKQTAFTLKMMIHKVSVPNDLVLWTTIQFATTLSHLPEADEYVFDFRNVGRIEPFALLFLSSELQRYRKTKPDSDFKAIHHEKCPYAAHMGFFKAFGVEYGNDPSFEASNKGYIPIQIIDVHAIKEEAAQEAQAPARFIGGKAREMSEMLTRMDKGPLVDTLTYSIREILRNVIEHSNSVKFGICAQYWPSIGKVSLAILDRGQGILRSLSANPHLNLKSDIEAIKQSLLPGISGTAYKGSYIDPDDAWANSGYGLYMTSQLCKEGGSFFIASGSSGLFLSENKERIFDIPFAGTALNLSFSVERISNLEAMLEQFRQKAGSSNLIKPSTSSTKLM